ncbi:MAG TPA: class I SAM-dependent methyltransferase [Spirochaetales bacterium]|nr:class I SAM-dependent methyltransferase [Spirochaetales bacterium]HRY55134.1 class I SAM-dependent methyltransferase [Spirochaetia bacterium]
MRCRLCSSDSTLPRLAGGLEYRDCPDCGYIGLAPRHWPSRAEEEARYRLHRNDPAEPGYRAYLGAFAELALEPFLGPGARILDFGSGPVPALSLLLAERGFAARPYDPFFAPGSSWRRRSWEAIVLHEVAEHLRSPGRTLAALARRLAPGGILAVRTRFPPEDPAGFESWWYRRDSTHLGFWRPESFSRLARDTGLELALVREPDLAVLRAATGSAGRGSISS